MLFRIVLVYIFILLFIIVLMDNFNLFYSKYIKFLSSKQILDYYQTLK